MSREAVGMYSRQQSPEIQKVRWTNTDHEQSKRRNSALRCTRRHLRPLWALSHCALYSLFASNTESDCAEVKDAPLGS